MTRKREAPVPEPPAPAREERVVRLADLSPAGRRVVLALIAAERDRVRREREAQG